MTVRSIGRDGRVQGELILKRTEQSVSFQNDVFQSFARV